MSTTSSANPETNGVKLSLWTIENALVELIQAREEVTEPEEIEQVEAAIRQYVEAEVRKVDNIRGFLKHCEMMANAAQEEANLQAERGRVWLRRRDRLKQMVQDVMEQAGVKRLEGRSGAFVVKGNGGVAPLEVTDADAVPDNCVRYVGWIRGDVWADILECSRVWLKNSIEAGWCKMERTVDNGLTRAALPVPGARLGDRGSHLEVK